MYAPTQDNTVPATYQEDDPVTENVFLYPTTKSIVSWNSQILHFKKKTHLRTDMMTEVWLSMFNLS